MRTKRTLADDDEDDDDGDDDDDDDDNDPCFQKSKARLPVLCLIVCTSNHKMNCLHT